MQLDLVIPTKEIGKPLPISAFLETHRETDFDAAAHGHRHPLALHNIAIESVRASLEDALASCQAYAQVAAEATELERSSAKKRVIEDLERAIRFGTQYFEDCRSIAFLFGETKSAGFRERFVGRYDRTVASARQFLAVQENEIKHKQARIRLVRAVSAVEEVHGYFVDGVNKEGALGPNPIVHDGGKTAYSFNRAFRQMLVCVMFTSRALASALQGEFGEVRTDIGGLGPLEKIACSIAQLGYTVFWDEVPICPVVTQTQHGLKLSTAKSGRSCFRAPSYPGSVTVELAGDGMTRSFSLPYMGLPAEPGKHRRRFAKHR